MDFQQLHNFQVLAQIKNVTRAAKELSLTQSALSKSIARLEEEVGVPLFERNPRGVNLNSFGTLFLEYVNRAIEEMNNAKEKINEMIDPSNGIIHFGFIPSLRSSFVPNIIQLFFNDSPNVRFQLSQGPTGKIIKQLEAAEVDLVFCSPQKEVENISTFPIIDEELFLVVPSSHRLANRKEVALAEVANDLFVHYHSDYPLRHVIDEFCQDAGFLPKVAIEGAEDEIIGGLVAANCGIALMPATQGLDQTKISMLCVTQPRCRRLIEMAWRTDSYMSPVVERFKDFVIHNISRVI
ncbi:lysR substrate-binding protein [Bacillus sp. OxB-1]|uniref:LysR family transcriptional regulator n=1 Tax=Bacillus sp. (strain OxB-1) TaxID=98228 RepID=UPI000581DFE8|nr:LysR family transcriptional regulator [Bacillus sp. OxB-1]BAQ11242.1 lysR substrate-binding protein [Bacillus sp. OxB-1]